MKASILTVGTELTMGQIVNKNAASLSRKLKELGVVVVTHLTVPDDKQLILHSLKYLEELSDDNNDLLFVTGGLGPTTDDFTRDVVAEWAEINMKFDAHSWTHIQERLTSRGFQVRDIQKQQCYYPENSQILFNSEGTASGFKFSAKKQTVYVLPGPPREIEAIWKEHIHSELFEKTKNIDKLVTKSWDTLGAGESDIAHLVEEALSNRPVGLEIGYRAHLPYVEVKLSYRAAEEALWSTWVTKVEVILKSRTVARDFVDISAICFKKIKDLDFTFYDFVSEGYLHSRLAAQLKNIKNWSFKQSVSTPNIDLFEQEDNFLALLPYESDKCIVVVSVNGTARQQKVIEAPMKSPQMVERRKQYFAEMALVELST